MSENFADLRGVVLSLVYRFADHYKFPSDDLIGEANRLFVKAHDSYDRKGGASLSAWIYAKIQWGLITYIKKQIRHYDVAPLEHAPEPTTQPDLFLVVLRGEISDRSRQALDVFLNSGAEFARCCRLNDAHKHTRLLASWKEHLSDLGWTCEQIETSLSEIRLALRIETPPRVSIKSTSAALRKIGLTYGEARRLVVRAEFRRLLGN